MFSKSMLAGGFLVLETVEARGGNYHQLPKSGCIREILGNTFSFLIYKEQSAGPAGVDAVTVKLVARKLAFPRWLVAFTLSTNSPPARTNISLLPFRFTRLTPLIAWLLPQYIYGIPGCDLAQDPE
jgi:hypothetical protein